MQNHQKKRKGQIVFGGEAGPEIQLSTIKRSKKDVKTIYTPSYTQYPHVFAYENVGEHLF